MLDDEEEKKEGQGALIKLKHIGPNNGSRNRIGGENDRFYATQTE